MAVASEGKHYAPYAPLSTVLNVVRYFRNHDVPEYLTPDVLRQIGVADGLIFRVLRTFEFLGLTAKDRLARREFKAITAATNEQYPKILEGWIKHAYGDIFRSVNVHDASHEEIYNAFRPYAPAGQRARMVKLFVGLCQEAHIQIRASVDGTRSTKHKPRSDSSTRPPELRQPRKELPLEARAGIHQGILLLLQDLPKDHLAWTKSDRDRWLKAFQSMLDYLYPVAEAHENVEDQE